MNNEKRNKHMTLDDRVEIQECLNKGMTFKAIAQRIEKDQTTVSKEVKRHGKVHANGMLLRDVDLAHVYIALETEIRRRRSKSNAVLTRARFGYELLFAHEFREETLTHAVIELMSSGMIEILSLKIYLAVSEQS